MYQASYDEVLEDDQVAARRVEYQALDRCVYLLTKAAGLSNPSKEGVEALYWTRQLWQTFIDELTSPDNALPLATRANLISIGLWVLKEADAIRLNKSSNYTGIADICAIVRDGLR